MPGFITHLSFGQKSISQIDDKYTRNLLRTHSNVYGLGLQGPDIFFYHVPAYLFHKKNIGNRIHNENVMLFFESLFDSRCRFKSQSDRHICDAYICGFMGHYTLDVWCHPYIYYRSNHFHAVENRGKAFDFGNHVSLETDIDHVVLRSFKGLRPTKFDYSSAIKPTLHEADVIALLLYRAIKNTFLDDKIPFQMIKDAIFKFAILNGAMCDPTGIKKHLVRRAEQLLFGCSTISAMIPSDTKIKFNDPCNKHHRRWHNPWNPSISSNQSIFELMDEATPDFLEKVEIYIKSTRIDYSNNKDEYLHLRNKLTSLLSDLSYCSGLPLE